MRGELKRVFVVSEGMGDCQGKSLALRVASYDFSSDEMHSDFGVQDEAKVLKLVDFLNRK